MAVEAEIVMAETTETVEMIEEVDESEIPALADQMMLMIGVALLLHHGTTEAALVEIDMGKLVIIFKLFTEI